MIYNFLSDIKIKFDYCFIGTKSRYNVEYLPDFEKILEKLTGFDGSNGYCFLPKNLSDSAYFFTDGRYLLQAEKQLKKISFLKFIIFDLHSQEFQNFKFLEEKKIIFDDKIFDDSFLCLFKNKNITFVECNNLQKIDQNTIINKKNAFLYEKKYSGMEYEKKFDLLTQNLRLNIYFFNSPSSIAWLLNIRGEDINFNLIFLCYGIFYKNEKKIQIFCHDINKLQILKNHNNVEIHHLDNLDKTLLEISNKEKVGVCEKISIYYKNLLKNKLFIEKDPCDLLRSKKTPSEIKNSQKIHLQDGAAIINFWYWLEESLKKREQVDEILIYKKLKEFRQKQKNFFSESFETIAGFNENGAYIHYSVKPETNKILTNSNGLLLLDSGGHYYGGTTDITRVFSIGKPTKSMKKHYTLVLKSHLKLLRMIFPYNLPMHQLNSIARENLWQKKLDFQHGFGHGVSNFLEVHESPYSINNRCTEKLVENIIISNEPGLYFENQYGIRIENLMFSTIVKSNSDNKQKFISFQNLTFVPYDLKLIDKSFLNKNEIIQINNYHHQTYKKLSKLINCEKILKFLKNKTKEIE
jgi:Xaa-Pro aminopeptidase